MKKTISKKDVLGAVDFCEYFKIPLSYDKKLVNCILGKGLDKEANKQLARLIFIEISDAYVTGNPALTDEMFIPAMEELKKKIKSGRF
jgi:hypothetical protein